MSYPIETEQTFTTQQTLGAGDATKTLVAAESGVRFVVTAVILTIITAAAQTLYVGDSSGTVKAISIAASAPANTQYVIQLVRGLELTSGVALIIKPAAAGPSVHCVVEGWKKRA